MQMAVVEAAQTERKVLVFLLYKQTTHSDYTSSEVLFHLQDNAHFSFPQHTDHAHMQQFWDSLGQALTLT